MFPTHPRKLSMIHRLILPLTVLLAAASAPTVQAGYQSAAFTFNLSNVLGPDNYGTVLLEAFTGPGSDHGLLDGQVRMTVAADYIPAYGDPANFSNFGIQKFGFNTDLDPYPTDITVTDTGGIDLGWTVKYDRNISMFGVFSVQDKGTGSSRGNPIVVTVSNLGSNATLDHFVFLSDPHKGSVPAYFVAHVAGFNEPPPLLLALAFSRGPVETDQSSFTSHYIAVTGAPCHPVPAPPAFALALLGGCGIGLRAWRRRQPACS